MKSKNIKKGIGKMIDLLGSMRLAALLLCACFANTALADVINLHNGDRLTGSVSTIAGGSVVFQTEYAGKIIVALSAISRMESDKTFEVRTRDGQRQEGKFSVTGEAQEFTSSDGAITELTLENVATAGENRLAITGLGLDWSSRADISAEKSTGNSDTQYLNLLVETVLKRDTVEHRFSLEIKQQEDDGEKTKDRLDFDYGYKRFISDKWFASGNAEYFEDELKDIDSRITLGAGLGYQFWDDSFGSLAVELGASYVIEDLAGVSEENPALRWALQYDRLLWSEQLEFFHKHSILSLVDRDRGEIIETSTGLRLAINSRVHTSFRIDVDHETKPAVDRDKTDVTYALGVGIDF